jgi:hypothetical protein
MGSALMYLQEIMGKLIVALKSENADENSVEILLEKFIAIECSINVFVTNLRKDSNNQEAIRMICEKGKEITVKLASYNDSDNKHLRSMFSVITQMMCNFKSTISGEFMCLPKVMEDFFKNINESISALLSTSLQINDREIMHCLKNCFIGINYKISSEEQTMENDDKIERKIV